MLGRASTITDLGDGTILRIGGDPAREAVIMEVARGHGFPVPRVIEIRDDALVIERIDGVTMGTDMRRRPWRIWRHVRTLADLHERLHRIPHGSATLVHYDLHPENVLVTAAGPVVLDWTNARGGRPEADVALTWLILETSAGVPGRVLARIFARQIGTECVRRGLADAREFRLGDPHVTDAERMRAKFADL